VPTQRHPRKPVHRLLIVITSEVGDAVLRDLVLVVAPAAEISRLDWLTNAEDDARSEAGTLAGKTAEATQVKTSRLGWATRIQ